MVGVARTALLGFFSLWANEAGAAVLRSGGARREAEAVDRLNGYTFTKFAQDFGRTYEPETAEYTHRRTVFEASLVQVRAINAKNVKESRAWRAGVHPFMDWTGAERQVLMGYKPSLRRPTGSVSFLHSDARALGGSALRLNATRRDIDVFELELESQGGLSATEGPRIRNQGNCGSCWAVSAVEAVEAQLQRSGGEDVQLSAQALVDCVPNPQHCGGTGGCEGATGELAYAFMRDYGIPLETSLQYQATKQQCPEQPLTGAWKPSTKRAMLSGWMQLPSNQARPLMQALVSQGPAVVNVDGKPWFEYEHGVFDGCEKDSVLGHAVLAKGFAEDQGRKYWLIQNSWGSQWGENGHIRLLRRDDDDSFCGTDRKPQEGVGCEGGPSEVTVCGTCGILYDAIIPQGARLEATARSESSSSRGALDDFGAVASSDSATSSKSQSARRESMAEIFARMVAYH